MSFFRVMIPVLALSTAVAVAVSADALEVRSGSSCQGHIVLKALFPTAKNPNGASYTLEIQNRSREMRTYRLTFSGFPQTTRLVEASDLYYPPLMPDEQDTMAVMHALPVSPTYTLGNVRVVYDHRTTSTQPSISVTDCNVPP